MTNDHNQTMTAMNIQGELALTAAKRASGRFTMPTHALTFKQRGSNSYGSLTNAVSAAKALPLPYNKNSGQNTLGMDGGTVKEEQEHITEASYGDSNDAGPLGDFSFDVDDELERMRLQFEHEEKMAQIQLNMADKEAEKSKADAQKMAMLSQMKKN